jgi:hypothetical protein
MEADEADFGGRGDEPGCYPPPFSDEWVKRFQAAHAKLAAARRELEQLEVERRAWPRLTA